MPADLIICHPQHAVGLLLSLLSLEHACHVEAFFPAEAAAKHDGVEWCTLLQAPVAN
jgi:hypothetical protein